jgi:hypothetical protein
MEISRPDWFAASLALWPEIAAAQAHAQQKLKFDRKKAPNVSECIKCLHRLRSYIERHENRACLTIRPTGDVIGV